jgi:SPP1 gp7 family putative phage head morphogenesis protein
LNQEIIVARSHRELDGLLTQLSDAMEAMHGGADQWEDVLSILRQLRHLDADVRLAGMVLGMLSPWLPELADVPRGTPKPLLQLSIRSLADLVPEGQRLPGEDQWRFPELEDAVAWLVRQQAIAGAEELSTLQQQLHRDVFTLDTESDVKTVARLQAALAESIKGGESLHEFRQRLGEVTGVTRSQVETAYRTNTKQAYLAGQERTLEQPRVKDRFRWVYYASTKDNRTRPSHWVFDGWVAEVGSPLHDLFIKRQSEYSCRCSLIPLDERKAKRYGIKDIGDVPAEFR